MFRIYIITGLLYTIYNVICMITNEIFMNAVDEKIKEGGIIWILRFIIKIAGMVVAFPVCIMSNIIITIKNFTK